jgi:hypothetical protein
MSSDALNTLSRIHGMMLNDSIDIINSISSCSQITLMHRLLVVSLAAFWEAFHEDLCRETLHYHRCPSAKAAEKLIKSFNNPIPIRIKELYKDVLGIPDIVDMAWRGSANKTGKTPKEFEEIINRMMNLRHDTAHGKFSLPVSAADCQEFLGVVLHLAIRTDDAVLQSFSKGTVAYSTNSSGL